MGETTFHQCDRCGLFTKYGTMDSEWESMDRLWHILVATAVAGVQPLNEEWCSDCIKIWLPDLDLEGSLRQRRKHMAS